MENKMILVDTSILIDYYRKTNKEKSIWVSLVRKEYSFAISAITKYEIYARATSAQLSFWDSIFKQISIISFDEACADTAVKINATLKRKRKQIDVADLFIAATAIAYNFTFVTLNKKHFDRIEGLRMIE